MRAGGRRRSVGPPRSRPSGHNAIITGGASGLGLSVAKRIVADGGKVALWDINTEMLAKAKTESGIVHTMVLDVADNDAVEQATSETIAALGHVDILVNSAGITGATAPVTKFSIES